MAGFKMDIDGDEEMMAKLAKLDRATQTTALASALSAGLAVTHREAVRLAPRDKGHLAANIGAEVNLANPTKAVGRVAPEKDAWYGIFAELGTRHHPPAPFLRPALDNTKGEVEKVVGGVLADSIRRAAI